MRYQEHSCRSAECSSNVLKLEVSHVEARRVRTKMDVMNVWSNEDDGVKILHYSKICEDCGHKIRGKFTEVSRWSVITNRG